MLKKSFFFSVLFSILFISNVRASCVSEDEVRIVYDCTVLSGLALQASTLEKSTQTALEKSDVAYLKRTLEVRNDFGKSFSDLLTSEGLRNNFFNGRIGQTLIEPAIRFNTHYSFNDTEVELRKTLARLTSDFQVGTQKIMVIQRTICGQLR